MLTQTDNDPLDKTDPLGLQPPDDDAVERPESDEVKRPEDGGEGPDTPPTPDGASGWTCIKNGIRITGDSYQELQRLCGHNPESPVVSTSEKEWFYRANAVPDALSARIDPPAGFREFKYWPEYGYIYEIYVAVPGPSAPTDGCSLPIANFLELACDVHDYGYDLVRYGGYLGVGDGWRTHLRGEADDQFLRVGQAICDSGDWFFRNIECKTALETSYRALRAFTLAEGPPK